MYFAWSTDAFDKYSPSSRVDVDAMRSWSCGRDRERHDVRNARQAQRAERRLLVDRACRPARCEADRAACSSPRCRRARSPWPRRRRCRVKRPARARVPSPRAARRGCRRRPASMTMLAVGAPVTGQASARRRRRRVRACPTRLGRTRSPTREQRSGERSGASPSRLQCGLRRDHVPAVRVRRIAGVRLDRAASVGKRRGSFTSVRSTSTVYCRPPVKWTSNVGAWNELAEVQVEPDRLDVAIAVEHVRRAAEVVERRLLEAITRHERERVRGLPAHAERGHDRVAPASRSPEVQVVAQRVRPARRTSRRPTRRSAA